MTQLDTWLNPVIPALRGFPVSAERLGNFAAGLEETLIYKQGVTADAVAIAVLCL